uniref:DDE Tnp4 domain-containing protein n=1 Tax=Odontella aurita TaxID=265563 RepID=A0A7S4NEM8_9STRA|mmetsp:Transcript_61848/g.182621  ORF Transcript_61848/g.182621 Transcript_61848/m.182621 type:complete len:205 (+) Transcript_61848:765-1379(+)
MTEEVDSKLRSEKWNDRYGGKRVVMWDNTNVNMPKPRDASMQRQNYSAYYGGNVGKGAVGLQLCGWMRTNELWDGAVSDSEYFEKSGILEMQAEFVANDSNNSDVQFTNILDKGYHAVLAAWRAGKQFVLQPAYKKSERKFTSAEVLLSAAVAADRSGNERAVNVAKRCFILGKGIDPSHRLDEIDDIWLVWGFQANFMFASVL